MKSNNVILVSLVVCLNCILSIETAWYEEDLAGSYCEARTGDKCCSSRQDNCSAPILGTYCYCDEFCDRLENKDCCPDFEKVCRGGPGSVVDLRCYVHDEVYKEGETTKINCNTCECRRLNDKMELLCESKKCLVDEEILDRVNRNHQTFGWRASNYTHFWGESYDRGLSYRLGTILQGKVLFPISQEFNAATIPRTFDARIRWPGIISRPRDQGWCNSSWIFSTVSVASDRFAVEYGNDQNFLSPQQILTCSGNKLGCDGGDPTQAWTYMRKYGLVSEACYPWEGAVSTCSVSSRRKQQNVKCPAYPRGPVQSLLHRVGPAYRIAGELGIMHEILTNGPVQATMKVSRDFFSYNTGIYKCMNMDDDVSAYHSVRIVGWGEEIQNYQSIKYWIVANSWGEWWGENGFFRIRRGVNECTIENYVIAAWANVGDVKAIKELRYRLESNNI